MPEFISGPVNESPRIALASLAEVTGSNGQTRNPIAVHFNPASLQLQLSNELKDTTRNERKQYIAKSTAKLTMDLIFDTTDTGSDVTTTTRKIQALVVPPAQAGRQAEQQIPPPLVIFEWGTVRFKGIAETYKETIDFFSAEGIPLRSTINLTLSRQDQVFDNATGNAESPGGAANDAIFDAPAGSAQAMADSTGTPEAARGLAATNGEESLRFGSGSPLSVSGGVNLNAPAAFANGSFGGSMNAGIVVGGGVNLGIGGSAGFGIGTSGGVTMGLQTGSGVSVSTGISGMARLSAAEGAFNGLIKQSGTSKIKIDTARLLPQATTESMTIGSKAQFGVGGRVTDGSDLRIDSSSSSKLKFF
jgi:hypothetical protein